MLISYCNTQNQFMELELPPAGGVIGYDEANFIIIDEIGVSSLHMRLSSADGKLFAEDLQSLNGTYLNRNLLTEKTEVKNGNSILIGLVLSCFEKNNDSWSITAIRQDSSLFIVDESEASISASPSETYKISSIDGYFKEIKASDDGVLKINNLSPGEYRFLSQNKKNP